MQIISSNTTLIIASYNRPAHLERTLFSLVHQTILPTQIIIADDGSDLDILSVVNKYQHSSLKSINIEIISQKHQGFRKCTLLNKAIRASSGDYIIHTDCDMFLERHFIEDHLKLAKPGRIVGGGRAKLNKSYGDISKFNGLTLGNFLHFSRPLRLFRGLKLPFIHNRHVNAVGNNMSYYKADVMAVNGYDEAIVDTGGEDVDISLRMTNNGCELLRVSGKCIGYHLWHSYEYRSKGFKIGKSMRKTLLLSHKTWTEHGINSIRKILVNHID